MTLRSIYNTVLIDGEKIDNLPLNTILELSSLNTLILSEKPDFYKYSIVRTVASGNMTVALKNYLGTDPSVTTPIKIQIGDTVRTITSALSVGPIYGVNIGNGGSSELATKEIDRFVFLFWSSINNAVGFGISRIPYGNFISDFAYLNDANEKALTLNITANLTDPVVNIGRFNAILSAGPGYTWSIPATSDIRNYPIFETRKLEYIPQFTNSILSGYNNAYYQIISNRMYVGFNTENRTFTSGSGQASVSLPFSPNETIPKVIYTLGNSSARPNNTYMTQIQDGKIKFRQGNDFTGFTGSETSIFLKFDDTLPL